MSLANSPEFLKFDRSHAILIGIDSYANGIPRLKSAVRDAAAVGKVLSEKQGYSAEYLLNENASLLALRRRLTALPSEFGAQDRLILYFAGHGLAEDLDEDGQGPRGYLLPQDGRRSDLDSFLSMAELQQILRPLNCRHLLIILDCCFAGAFRWSTTRSVTIHPVTLYKERYERYVKESAWQVLTSSAHDEVALDVISGKVRVLGNRSDDLTQNSPFAAALIRGLMGDADRPGRRGDRGDGVMIAAELWLYIEDHFATEQTGTRAQQRPMLWSLSDHEKGQYVFRNPELPLDLPNAEALTEDNNPYQGLEPYTEKQAEQGLFFGRKAVLEELCAQVESSPLTILVGGAGSGKTSLVQAGLLPNFRSRKDPVWKIAGPHSLGLDPEGELGLLAAQFGSPNSTLPDAIWEWRGTEPNQPCLLVIEKLEEIFSAVPDSRPDQHPAAKFADLLSSLLFVGQRHFHIVLSVRADCEPMLNSCLRQKDIKWSHLTVPAMTRAELREVIEGPALQRVLFFDPPELVDTILDEVTGMPGMLPLLSFTLREMYRAYVKEQRADRNLTQELYEKLGGAAGALTTRASEAVSRFKDDPPSLETLKWLLLRLSNGATGTRRQVTQSELTFTDPYELGRVIRIREALLDDRLLIDNPNGIVGTYELAHDRLLVSASPLGSLIASDISKADAIFLNQITADALRWKKDNDNDVLVEDNVRLWRILKQYRKAPEKFNEIETGFIRRSRTQKILKISAVMVLAISIVVSALAMFIQNKEAQLKKLTYERDAAIKDLTNTQTNYEKFIIGRELDSAKTSNERLTRTNLLESAIKLLDEREPLLAALYAFKTYKSRFDVVSAALLARALEPIDATLMLLRDHQGEVTSAVFSPDGKQFVTTSQDNTVRIWDTRTGSPLRLLGQSKPANRANSEMPTANEASTIAHSSTVWGAAYSPDGLRIATVGQDNTLRIWDARTGQQLYVKSPPRGDAQCHPTAAIPRLGLNDVAYQPDGAAIATAGSDGCIYLWRAQDADLLGFMWGHKWVNHVAFSPDSSLLVSTGRDSTIRVWDLHAADLATGKSAPIGSYKDRPAGNVWSAEFSPDGRSILAATDNHALLLKLEEEGHKLVPKYELEGHHDWLSSASFSSDGLYALTADWSGRARIWELTGQAGPELLREYVGHEGMIWSAAFQPRVSTSARELVVLTAGADRSVRMWSIKPDALLRRLQNPKSVSLLRSAMFNQKTKQLALALLDSAPTVLKWGQVWGKDISAPLHPLKDDVASIITSPDGLYSITGDEKGEVKIWLGAESQGPLLPKHADRVVSIAFTKDGARFATGSWDKTVVEWNLGTRKAGTPFSHEGRVAQIAYSPDKESLQLAVALWTDTIAVWDRPTRKRISLQGHRGRVSCLAYSPTIVPGHQYLLASGGSDRTVRLWRFSGGKWENSHMLLAHDREVTSVQFSPNGHFLISGSEDKTVAVWDPESGQLLYRFRGHNSPIVATAWIDGKQLMSIDKDMVLRLWDFHLEAGKPEQLQKLIDCNIAWQLDESGRLGKRAPTPCPWTMFPVR